MTEPRDAHERNNHVLQRAIEEITKQAPGAGLDPLVGAVIDHVTDATPAGGDRTVMKRIQQDHRRGHVTRDDLETVQRINRDNEAIGSQSHLDATLAAADFTRDPNRL